MLRSGCLFFILFRNFLRASEIVLPEKERNGGPTFQLDLLEPFLLPCPALSQGLCYYLQSCAMLGDGDSREKD
jgi:hypothetical protein